MMINKTTHLANESMHGVLGKMTDYPKTYDPSVLYPIPRVLSREKLSTKVFFGFDYWHCYELSWLNKMGISQVAMARLVIDADSQFIVESKSLKLYLNSLNFTMFDNKAKLAKTIGDDLSNCLKSSVSCEIYELDDDEFLITKALDSTCIDHALDDLISPMPLSDTVNHQLLSDHDYKGDTVIYQRYHSHLLRSNCPVTNQPDWGTVEISFAGGQLDVKKLLAYILSYRNHNGFHEACVEQIYDDLTTYYRPTSLMVRAWYTRRGGIDINPVRVSDKAVRPSFGRLIRQ